MIPKATMKLPNEPGIYMITCTANGRFYIGSAVRLRARWNTHKRDLRNGNHHSPHLQKTWDKYGVEAFIFTVLEKCAMDDLLKREQYYLDEWQPFEDRGFNECRIAGSRLGCKHSTETRLKLSAAHKGRTLSPEHRKKIGQGLKGYKQPPEVVAKTVAARTGTKRSPETCAKISAVQIGRKLSLEHCAKMSAALKGRKRPPEVIAKITASKRKFTYILTSNEGETFKTSDLKSFCLEHDLGISKIYSVINGKRPHHKGWKVRRI